MSLSVKQVIEARAPQYEGVARLDDLIALAAEETDSAFFGKNYNKAVALRVLHWLDVRGRGGAPGAVISESEGRLSRSYAAPAKANDLTSTAWGQELDQMIASGGMVAMSRMVP